MGKVLSGNHKNNLNRSGALMPFLVLFFIAPVILILSFTLIWPVSTAHALEELYISPSGDDTNPGTLAQPLKTLDRARVIVRASNQSMSGDITVYLRGGTYRLQSTVSFDADDSGMNGYSVIYKNYPGEKSVISGGEVINNWIEEGQIWKVDIGTGRSFRQLYVNGERQIRARTDQPLPVFQKASGGYLLNNPNISGWQNISDVEFVSTVAWKQYRCSVHSVSLGKIIMQQPCWGNSQTSEPTMSTPGYIENAIELLDSPREWYYNKTTGWLYYQPYIGQSMASAEVIIPNLESLVIAEGTPSSPIENIKFEGISFEHSTWNGPSTNEGYAAVQATIHYEGESSVMQKVPAAVVLRSANDMQLSSNVFTHLGGTGVTVEESSQGNTVVGNHFTDISGSAIQIGDIDQPHVTDDLTTSGSIIENNYIRDIGKEFQDAVGVWQGYASGSNIRKNELHQLPYTGISIGWGWGNDDPTVAKNNRIENNYIHDHVLTLNDGGGVYSLGAQPGNVISGNVVTGQRQLYGSIYLDAGSRYITVSHNALFNNQQKNLFAVGGQNIFSDNYWQNRYVGDIDILEPPQFGPNTFENNHAIQSPDDIPEDLINNAGLQDAFINLPLLAYPTNLQSNCYPSGQQVHLTWQAAQGNPEYVLVIDNLTDVASPTSIQTSATTYLPSISPNSTYRWWVRSVDDDTHVTSGIFNCRDTVTPSIPTNLTMQSRGQYEITIGWDQATDNDQIQGYIVWRNGVQVGMFERNIFFDVGLSPNTNYTYSVQSVDRAVNASGLSSSFSVMTVALPEVVLTPPPPPEPVIVPSLPPQVLGSATFRPIMSTLKLTKGIYSYQLNNNKVSIRPFGTDYRGDVWARSVDFGPGGKFFIFLNTSPYKKGLIKIFQADGRLFKTYQPYGGLALNGLNATALVATSDVVYLAIGATKFGTTVRTYILTSNGLTTHNSLSVATKPGNVLVDFQKIYPHGYGLVTMVKFNPGTLKVWIVDAKTKKFIEDKNINKTKIRM